VEDGLLLYSVKFILKPHISIDDSGLDLLSLTPEGKIVLSLKHGKHMYSELKFETGLSDRWLWTKLKELESAGIVRKDQRWYSLAEDLKVSSYELSLYMSFQAKRLADELARMRSVRAIVLFGAVPQGSAAEYSDIDIIVIVEAPTEKTKEKVLSKISKLELDYHLTIDPIIMDEDDFLANVQLDEGGIFYGIAEGFEVMHDKTKKLGQLLANRVDEVRRTHERLEEGGIWLRVR